jgi:hypothetical protein
MRARAGHRQAGNLLRKAPRFSSNSHQQPLAISPIPATMEERVFSKWMLVSLRTAINEMGLPLHPRRNPPRLPTQYCVDELCSPVHTCHKLPNNQNSSRDTAPNSATITIARLSWRQRICSCESETRQSLASAAFVWHCTLKSSCLWSNVCCAGPGSGLDGRGWSTVSGRLIQLPSGPTFLAPKEPEALAAPVTGFPKMGSLHARHSVLKRPESRGACSWRARSAASHLHTRLVEAARFGDDGRAGIAEAGPGARPIHVDAC